MPSIGDYFSDDDVKTAAEAIKDVASDPDSPPSTRLSAATFIIEQRHGKARQFIEQTVAVQGYQDLLGKIIQAEEKFIQIVDVTQVPQLPAPPTLEDFIR
jgi:hypothetical protein